MKTKRLTELALLTTVALIIFVIELRIPNPIPIPGVKLGLANIITVYALYHYRIKEVFLVVMVRILLGSIFGGNMMALLYSVTGSLFCLAGMQLFCRMIPQKHLWICSVLGAVLHNIGQTLIACLIAGWGLFVYFPFLLVSGCLAGAFTGICAQLIIGRIKISAIT